MNAKNRTYILSWAIANPNTNQVGGTDWHPAWALILEKLADLEKSNGTVSLDMNNGLEDSKSLSLHAEDRRYFIVFNDKIDGRSVTRTSYDPKSPLGMHSMHGSDWGLQTIFRDYDLAYDVFKQFYETGEVQTSRLS